MTTETQQPTSPPEAESQPQPEMCCDGERTAEEHRKESPDGKCCVD